MMDILLQTLLEIACEMVVFLKKSKREKERKQVNVRTSIIIVVLALKGP